MKPAYSDNWTKVYATDALSGAKLLAPSSIATIITSPPYWGLRSYLPDSDPNKAMELGTEPTPELYVERLVEIFRVLRSALRDDGTLWLNLGDSYASSGTMGVSGNARLHEWNGDGAAARGGALRRRLGNSRDVGKGRAACPRALKPKDLIGLPWMVAFALRADGWYLRSEITWVKKAPMPESVRDRPTSATEKLFLFAKSPRYFYDAEAVREEDGGRASGNGFKREHRLSYGDRGQQEQWEPGGGRNMRNYLILGPAPYKGAHYATFPPDLVYPCVKAGTSERGVCAACGAPWERVVEKTGEFQNHGSMRKRADAPGAETSDTSVFRTGQIENTHTVGWQAACPCDAETVPATVLDPFVGSGTTLWAARKLGRRSVGFDLDARNLGLIEERMGSQGVLF